MRMIGKVNPGTGSPVNVKLILGGHSMIQI